MPKVIPEYKEEAKKRIIEAALEVFCRKGFHATKMNDIAKELGISKGAIYTYFKNKDDLFTKAAQYYRQAFESDMNKRIEISEGQDFFDILFDFFTEYLKFGFALPFELMNLAVNDEEIKSFLVDDGKKDREYFFKYLIRLQKEGRIRQDLNLQELADQITTIFYGLYMNVFLGMSLENAKVIWNSAIERYR